MVEGESVCQLTPQAVADAADGAIRDDGHDGSQTVTMTLSSPSEVEVEVRVEVEAVKYLAVDTPKCGNN